MVKVGEHLAPAGKELGGESMACRGAVCVNKCTQPQPGERTHRCHLGAIYLKEIPMTHEEREVGQ